jgi:hypothetical protein
MARALRRLRPALVTLALAIWLAGPAAAQLRSDLPDPFRPGERWGQLPEGRS